MAVIDDASLSVTISGVAQENQVLTATPIITDEDDQDAKISYQWQSSTDGQYWTDIRYAADSTYTVAEADENKFIRVEASFVDDTEQTITADSDPTSAVIDDASLAVAITGTAQENQVLTANPTIVGDEDDQDATVSYQWQSSTDGKYWTDIRYATDSTYTVAEADENNFIRVEASFVDDTGQTITADSDPTSAVIDDASLSVTITGIAQENQVLTANPAIVGDEDDQDATVSYQWQSSADGKYWTDIRYATDSTYTVAEADENKFIRVETSFVDDTGQTITADSDPTSAVIDDASLSVAISGVAKTGHMLSATPTIGDTDDGEAIVSYKWQISTNGSDWNDIDGAKGSTFTLTSEDENKFIRVEASFVDDTGQTITADSDPIAAVNDTLVMTADSFTAIESVTGDTIRGVLFDNTGRYSVGSSVTVPGPDNLGGTRTYTVTGITGADAKHLDASYSGFAYDIAYFDKDLGTTFSTFYGAVGLNTGVNDRTVNYSGNQGLGSDGDLVSINNRFFGIASGKYVVPEGLTVTMAMTADTFTAVESVTGDTITGIFFDNTGRYSVGSAVITGPDNLGGTWTYTVTGIAAADAKHQDVSYSGFVYDTAYLDNDLGTTVTTFYGATGLNTGVNDRTANYSGSQGLGSDGDLVTINNKFFGIASGKYVVPEGQTGAPTMTADTFTAVESVTGDTITGVLFDNTGRYSVGSSVIKGPDDLGGTWTYTVTAIAAADATHQDASYSGFVYDTAYRDQDLGVTLPTFYGATGLNTGVNDRTGNYSGNQGLGSDGDLVTINNKFFADRQRQICRARAFDGQRRP